MIIGHHPGYVDLLGWVGLALFVIAMYYLIKYLLR